MRIGQSRKSDHGTAAVCNRKKAAREHGGAGDNNRRTGCRSCACASSNDIAARAGNSRQAKGTSDHLTKNADNVGAKFPEEARKMHYGEIEHRSIYGVATPEEAKELSDEGIEFHPLPTLPDERN
jgi:hypothetical protein